ncbi:MAG: hypothetical protein ACU0CT_02515 [Paracoccaceae bacterium]|jgi:hypothetical protein
MSDKYWTVEMHVFAFETIEEACDYRDRLCDVFCDMPESEGYGSAYRIIEEGDAKRDRIDRITTSLGRASELTLQRIETELGLTPRPESPDAGRPMTPVSERGMHE